MSSVVAWHCLGVSPTDAACQVLPNTEGLVGEYRVRQWTTAEGLPQNSVNDIVILPNGEMWLATFGGLARFDGQAFRVLDMAADDGLPTNRFVALQAESDASFFFLSQEGYLGRVDRGRPVLLVKPPTTPLDFLDLQVTGSGRIYGRAVNGSVWRTDGRQPWRPVPGERSGSIVFHGFAVDADGALWGVSSRVLAALEDEEARVAWSLEEGRSVFRRKGGGLWVGTKSGVRSLREGRFAPLEIHPALNGTVTVIESGGEDTLWVATPGQVSRLDHQRDGTWRQTPLPLRLPIANRIAALHEDRADALWIGTVGGGLYRINPVPIQRLGMGEASRGIGGLASDGRNGAYVVGGCRVVFHLKASGTSQPVSLRNLIGNGPTGICGVSLARGRNDSVWARIGPNLVRFQGATAEARLITGLLPFEEGPVVPNEDGSVWVVSRNGRVQVVSAGGEIIRELTLPPPLYSASLGPDGSLWLGGDSQVWRLAGETIERFGQAENMPRGVVRDIVPESDGTTWIGTYGGGVGRLRDGHVVRLTGDQGLPDNSVSRMLVDGQRRLWVSTNRGIGVIDRARLDQVASDHAGDLMPVVLGIERGVPEADFGSPAGFADASGRLWFGTIDGVVVVDATRFPFNQTPLTVRIDELRADNRLLPIAPVVRVPALTTRLRLDFTAFELLYPGQVRFRFRFEGIDRDWIQAGTARYVDWTPVGPGRHRFLVEARNEDGIWSTAPAAIVLDVLPAWWQTTMFRAGAVLGVLMMGIAVVRLRIRAIERRHAARVRVLEEQRQAADQMASLRSQLELVSREALAGELAASIAHEVRQPLGAIVNNAEAGKRHSAQYVRDPGNLESLFADIVSDAMRASEIIQGLRGFLQPDGPEAAPVDLSAVVREVLPMVRRELEDNSVQVELALQEPLPQIDGLRVQLSQIVVNLVINACEAMAGASGERRLSISTAASDGRVELIVCDTGPGLVADVEAQLFEPFVTTKAGGLGVGLAVCRSIAERHGGRLTAKRISDVGLCMTLTLPVARPVPES